MACACCKVEKLSEEFCPNNASVNCDHPCLVCLRCLIGHVDKCGKCPYPDCNAEINKSSDTIILFRAILSQLFPVHQVKNTDKVQITGNEQQFVIVTGLTGDITRVPFSPSMTVQALKDEIKRILNHEQNKQKLLYNDKEMDKVEYKLSDYGVTSNATICLVVRLYGIPENFNHVVFDLTGDFQ